MNIGFLRSGSKCLKFSKIRASACKVNALTLLCRNYVLTTNVCQCRNYSLLLMVRNWAQPRHIFVSKFLKAQNVRLVATTRNRCWHCNAVVAERDLVCLSCGCIQELRNNLNYFEIFKESPQFDIDARYLSVKFRRLQSVLHPDKFASRSEMEQQYSVSQSSLVNKAYQILRNPMERGLYLLELHGKPLKEDDVMPTEFLGDVMEINEQLAACDAASGIELIRHTNNAKLELLFGELSQAFKEKNIERAREILAKLKYYMSIDTQIRKKEDDLGIYRDD